MKVPQAVKKILSSKGNYRLKFAAIRKFYKGKTKETGGCFSRVIVCEKFVVKYERPQPSHPRSCSMKADFNFLTRMRKSPKNRSHFPATVMVNGFMIQERCDVNYDLFDRYNQQLEWLGNKFGVEDIHEENIGWRNAKSKSPTPVFIDVGFRMKPVKPTKSKKNPVPKWAKGLEAYKADRDYYGSSERDYCEACGVTLDRWGGRDEFCSTCSRNRS